ncbi:transcriptional regulator [Camelimonas fluminis]|uniref:HU family DNA-binding protein n=1 Tax=Camelimonas fluminis TaxID=1576911 RepID=A0ABV7UEL8_9HYPH|nr:HU family DNA-binding protein [Camelimonas fluminis]GHE76552.1 transcriptional regulator [Camelimonas fluminis]
MSTITKKDFVALLAERTDQSKAAVEAILTALGPAITDLLKDGNHVPLPGLGKFAVTDRGPRTARNPKTGQPIDIPARKVVSFKVGKLLKDATA